MNLLLAGIWMSLAWPLRGQFGHLEGALIPGAFAALSMTLQAKDEKWRKAFPLAVILGSAGFSLGGHLAYGKIIEHTIQTPDFQEALSGFGRIFLIGSVWGGLGSTLLGFGFSEKPFTLKDGLFLAGLFLFWFVLLGIFNLEQFDLASFAGGLVLLQAYNFCFKKSRIIGSFGLAGFLGFGVGFLIAVLLLRTGNHGFFGATWAWWALRDQILGFIGGIFLAAAAQKCQTSIYSAPNKSWEFVRPLGFFWLLVFIPAVNVRNVISYWSSAGHFPALGLYILTGHLIFFFLIVTFGILKMKKDGFENPRLLKFSALFMIWFLSFWAIAKETAVMGRGRWESAYSLFLIFSVFITTTLFFKRKIQQKPL